jgi:deoxyribodipyrimidine photo-lyase
MLIDYKKGEKYFAESLIDYDVASNGGNWLWIMGGGADSQQWFRIFNPWLQSKENDPDCKFIKKWVPELEDVPSKAIHEWFKYYGDYKGINYNKPILDYDEQKEKAIKMYKDALY